MLRDLKQQQGWIVVDQGLTGHHVNVTRKSRRRDACRFDSSTVGSKESESDRDQGKLNSYTLFSSVRARDPQPKRRNFNESDVATPFESLTCTLSQPQTPKWCTSEFAWEKECPCVGRVPRTLILRVDWRCVQGCRLNTAQGSSEWDAAIGEVTGFGNGRFAHS